jgi:hypothetical protein
MALKGALKDLPLIDLVQFPHSGRSVDRNVRGGDIRGAVERLSM